MSFGPPVDFKDRVAGRWYKWDIEVKSMREAPPHEPGAYEHRETTNHYGYGAGVGGSYNYSPAKLYDGVDKLRWRRTWNWLVRFSFSPDYHQNTRYAPSPSPKGKAAASVPYEDVNHRWVNGKWMTRTEYEAYKDKLPDKVEYSYGGYD